MASDVPEPYLNHYLTPRKPQPTFYKQLAEQLYPLYTHDMQQHKLAAVAKLEERQEWTPHDGKF